MLFPLAGFVGKGWSWHWREDCVARASAQISGEESERETDQKIKGVVDPAVPTPVLARAQDGIDVVEEALLARQMLLPRLFGLQKELDQSAVLAICSRFRIPTSI